MPSPKLKGKIREKRFLKNNKSFKKKKKSFPSWTKRTMIISEDFLEQLEKEVLSTYKINWTNFVDIIFEFPIWSLMKKKKRGKRKFSVLTRNTVFLKWEGRSLYFQKMKKAKKRVEIEKHGRKVHLPCWLQGNQSVNATLLSPKLMVRGSHMTGCSLSPVTSSWCCLWYIVTQFRLLSCLCMKNETNPVPI